MAYTLSSKKHVLIDQAKRVLAKNWTGNYTKPSPKLYPHQWNWDSGFIAIGYSYYNQQKAQAELLSLFRGQWPNGMLPHIVFNPRYLNYFPGRSFWKTAMPTSGITQPPIQATAASTVYKNAANKETALEFLKEIFPRIKRAHQYLYRNRDPENEGLVYIHHPWESGLDNLPIWDEPLSNVPTKEVALQNNRTDLKLIPEDERPTDEDYKRYVYLVNLFIKNNYDDRQIQKKSPFLVQNVLFNSILHQSNKDLLKIAKVIGEDSKEIENWIEKTAQAINEKLFNRQNAIFYDFDLVSQKQIKIDTAAGFLPLYSGIPSKKTASLLYNHLNSFCFCQVDEDCYALANYDKCADDFDRKNYWRGPVWININWLLYKGMLKYGFNDYAQKIKKSAITLVKECGFYEYFDPDHGRGYGSKDFSWTAALLIDFLLTKEEN